MAAEAAAARQEIKEGMNWIKEAKKHTFGHLQSTIGRRSRMFWCPMATCSWVSEHRHAAKKQKRNPAPPGMHKTHS